MARIRSVHPGQWTDEDFVECDYPARLLAIAIRNEADDQGVFEWKPRALKMRLFPADTLDLADLLDELVANRIVRRFEVEGKAYGAIRNFRRYQRPKKPNAVYPLPADLRDYVAIGSDELTPGADEGDGSEPVGNQFGTGGEAVSETAQQMEEEGGRMEKEEGEESPSNEGVPARGRSTAPAGPTAQEISLAVDLYNATAEQSGLPRAQKLTDKRRRALAARLRDCGGLSGWEVALEKLAASPFLTGRTDRGFRADLDFLCQERSFTKLLEGSYDDRRPAPGARPTNAVTDAIRNVIRRADGSATQSFDDLDL